MASSGTKFRIPKRKVLPAVSSDAASAVRDVKPKLMAAGSWSSSPVIIDDRAPQLKPLPPPPPSDSVPFTPPLVIPHPPPPSADTSNIPEGWIDCANGNVSASIHGLIAIKTPLTAEHTAHLPAAARWTPLDAVMACGARRVRLLVDLTASSSHHYAPAELPVGIRHLKLPCESTQLPSEAAVQQAIKTITELRVRGAHVLGGCCGAHQCACAAAVHTFACKARLCSRAR